MEAVGEYLVTVTAAAMVCGIIGKLVGTKGAASAVIRMLCGMFMALTVLKPWVEIPVYDFQEYASSFSEQAQLASLEGQQAAEEYKRALITDQVCTYILDKAASMGLQLRVEVELAQDESCMPCHVELCGNATQVQRAQLQKVITEELGIEKEDQVWIEAS